LIVQRRRSKTMWAWTALGVGIASAAAAGVLYVVGQSQGANAYHSYSASKEQVVMDMHWEDVEAAETKFVVGHVLMGVAAAAIGFSVYQFLTRPDREIQARRPGAMFSDVQVSVSAGASGAGMFFVGRF
jgi:hypothetical protein